MKCITHDESLAWMQAHGLDSLGVHQQMSSRWSLRIPGDSGRKISLARSVLDWFPQTDCLLLVKCWGIWPSAENPRLCQLVRCALGENRPLQDAPGHLFHAIERDDLECVLDLCLYNFWDAILVTSEASSLVTLSHDEWMEIRCAPHMQSAAIITAQLFADEPKG